MSAEWHTQPVVTAAAPAVFTPPALVLGAGDAVAGVGAASTAPAPESSPTVGGGAPAVSDDMTGAGFGLEETSHVVKSTFDGTNPIVPK